MELAEVAPQTIKTPSGDELVVLPRKDYDVLVEALAEAQEELSDIAVLDQRRREMAAQAEPVLPAEVSAVILQGRGRVAALREWRGLSQQQLGDSSGLGIQVLADIESRKRQLTDSDRDRLVDVLKIPPYWLTI